MPDIVSISHLRRRKNHHSLLILSISLVFLSYFSCLSTYAQPITLERDLVWATPAGSPDWSRCGASRETACDLPTAVFSIKSLSHGTNATILLTSGTFHLPTRLAVDAWVPTVIRTGPGEATNAIISPGFNATDVFLSIQTPEATVEGVIFQHFTSPAVVISEDCRATFIDCGFYSNGGAVVSQSANLTFTGCTFEDNVIIPLGPQANVPHNGGAVSIQIPISDRNSRRMNITFDSCTFSGNGIHSPNSLGRATGGAISILFADAGGLEHPTSSMGIKITKCVFIENIIHVEAISGRHLDATAAPQLRGGAIHVAISCITHVEICDSLFLNNSIAVHGVKSQAVLGGAVDLSLALSSSTIRVFNTTWAGNVASAGSTLVDEASAGICAGGALNLYTTAWLTVQNSTFSNNVCAGAAGGLFAGPVTGGAISYKVPIETRHEIGPGLSIWDSTFINNSVIAARHESGGLASSAGGAVSFSVSSSDNIRSFHVANSQFIGNSAASPCSEQANVYGGALSIDSPSGSLADPILLESPIMFENVLFERNVAGSSCPSTMDTSLTAGGGALWAMITYLSDSSFNISNCTFRWNRIGQIWGKEDKSHMIGYGGALRVTTQATVGISLNNSIFENNSAQGSGSMQGGAVDIQSSSEIIIVNSTFVRNNVTCVTPYGNQHLNCLGGAISSLSGSLSFVLDCSFLENVAFVESTCSSGSGGAISTASNMVIERCNFTSNYVRASIASGGAVISSYLDINKCRFDNNSASGIIHASGGSITISGTRLSVKQTIFQNGQATNHFSNEDHITTCDEKYFVHRSVNRPPAAGGAIAINAGSSFLQIHDSTFINHTSPYGGTMLIARPMWESSDSSGLSISGVAISNSSATVGGSIFVLDVCRQGPKVDSLCDAGFQFSNSTASSYGDLCASWPNSLVFQEAPPKFLAPGQLFPTTLVLFDLFNTTVRGITGSITVSLTAASEPTISFLSGATLDSVYADERGVFSFGGSTILGFANASASVRFTSAVPALCSRSRSDDLSLSANISTTGCPPAYFDTTSSEHPNSAILCELCPPQTYLFPSSGKNKCVPCSEEPHERYSEEEHYSCLNTPTLIEEEGYGRGLSDWVVSAGYYPSPSLDAPTELLRCPNEACQQFECKAYVDSSFKWQLNCSACPSSRHGAFSGDHYQHQGNESTVNPDDCHCEIGYTDRLCSRCSCDSNQCYFASGAEEERRCSLCRQKSTVINVTAFAVLQVSLIVFLIFKRSALALLLSEAAIVTTLLIIGVGEAWMFDLVLILGLLFIITTVGQTVPKNQHTNVDQESETEPDDDSSAHGIGNVNNHKHHGHSSHHYMAARTAAIVKIVIFFFQTITSIVKHAAWPSWIGFVMKQLDALNLRVSGIECFAPAVLSNPVIKLAVQLAMPWILGLNIILAALLAATLIKINPVKKLKVCWSILCRKCASSKARNARAAQADSEEDDMSASGKFLIEKDIPSDDSRRPLIGGDDDQEPFEPDRDEDASSEWSMKELINKVAFSFFFLISASYFELSNLVLEALRPCEHGYMAAFPWIPCSFAHSQFVILYALGVGFLLLYTVGIPVFFGSIMLCNRRRILAGDPLMEARFGFLFESYRPALFWWELVWFLRRILLSFSVTLLVPHPGYQMSLILAVLLGSLFLHRSVKPFLSRGANLLDLVATACILFSVVMGSEIHHFSSTDTTLMTPVVQNVVWLFSAGVAVALFVGLLLPVFNSLRARWCRKKTL